jgi:hypothetical protein
MRRGTECVHQSCLASVGVAHKRNANRVFTPLGLGVVLLIKLTKFAFECGDALPNQTAVGLDLCFAGTFCANSAFLLGEVSPLARQARQKNTLTVQARLAISPAPTWHARQKSAR